MLNLNENAMIEISVIMPVYNGEKYLREAIDSILCQSFQNFEFIIVDDASTDRSLQIIQSYKDKRIILLQNEQNRGNYPSRNRGLTIATGKYICVMDADDIAYPLRLEKQYKYMEDHPELLAIGTNFDFSISSIRREKPLAAYTDLMIALLEDNTFLHPSLMIRTDVLRKIGGYDEKYVYSSDYELMTRLTLLGKVENLPDVLMMYRWHSSQISQSCHEAQKKYADEIRRKYHLAVINRFKSSSQTYPDEWTVSYPQIGRIICLYTYARYTGEDSYEQLADSMLDIVFEKIVSISSLGIERSLCGLGCGLIYLLRNKFVEGDEDEVLTVLDERLSILSMNWPAGENLSLCGWIHYLTLRLDVPDETSTSLFNKQTLIQLLDRLEESKVTVDDIIEDIRKIDALGIFPERTKRLLDTGKVVRTDCNEIDLLSDDMVTFVIPVRIDSSERQENLDVVLEQLSKRKRTKIILLEADTVSIYKVPGKYPNVTHRFVKDDNPVFYRTKYLNDLLREADTSIVGIWDTDVIVPNDQIDRSIADIREGKAVMSFPYDGRFNFCSLEDSFVFRNKRSIDFLKEKEYSNCVFHSVGGAFLVYKDIYVKAGGENEHFYGWGMEDQERVKRMEILGLPVSRVAGVLYHLFHSRNENSRYCNERQKRESCKEFLKVCGMSKDQLQQYICNWSNVTYIGL